ncbi:MAG: 2-(1,2-epoxy-1,2-dihydrophenyl)acetyl-CoA isomerase [Alphaproteobacteria bacterium]|nr:2-(1,2-epoxy-1,2-dihydrophenyl)acetyl-CoA isomerase [Alphaproteobacteria bacterium]
MIYKTIEFAVADNIARLTLNRPDVLNGLNAQMRAEITDAVRGVTETGARVLVITGNGRGFCSGQDLGGANNVAQIDLEGTLRDEYEPMLRAIIHCPIPTIAAVNGPAAGAGANLALAADVVIASEGAFFMQAFSLIGLIPDAAGTYFMPRNMGLAKAMGAALFADKISARQAADWGLIWESVPEAEFEAIIDARAKTLANGPTAAYAKIKRVLRASFENDLDAQLTLEATVQGEAGKTRDFAEGVLAFNEKRKPQYEGR